MNIPDEMVPLLLDALTTHRCETIYQMHKLSGEQYDFAQKVAKDCFDASVTLRTLRGPHVSHVVLD